MRPYCKPAFSLSTFLCYCSLSHFPKKKDGLGIVVEMSHCIFWQIIGVFWNWNLKFWKSISDINLPLRTLIKSYMYIPSTMYNKPVLKRCYSEACINGLVSGRLACTSSNPQILRIIKILNISLIFSSQFRIYFSPKTIER